MKEKLFSVTKKDLIIETFRAGGKGGQNQNKRDTGVRIKHPASGAVAESREERGQLENKQAAWQRLIKTPKFDMWLKKTIAQTSLSKSEARRVELQIASHVERQMDDRFILTEVQDENGKWIKNE